MKANTFTWVLSSTIWRKPITCCAPRGRRFLVEDVKVEREFNYDHVPVGSLKTTDPDGNILDITERKDEWDGVQL